MTEEMKGAIKKLENCSCSNYMQPAIDMAINALKIQDRLLQMCEQVDEDDKMVFVGINDIRAILRGDA